MGNITKNLSRHEWSCKCGCGFDTVDYELPKIIQGTADMFAAVDGIDVRIDITGPNRCVEHNEKVQKEANSNYVPYSSKSQHLYGRAADFKLFNRQTGGQVDPDRVADFLEKRFKNKYGVGWYNGRTHIDTRTNGPARWDNR